MTRRGLAGLAARWQQWSGASSSRKIFAASLLVGGITGAVSLVGIAREAVVARVLGLGDEVDAFVLALALATFPVSMIAGSFHSLMVPAYVGASRSGGADAARRVAGAILGRTALWLCVAMAVFAVVVPLLLPLLSSGFSDEKRALVFSLFFVLLPGLAFAGIAIVLGGILHAAEQFASAALSPISVHFFVLLVLILWGAQLGGAYALALGTVLGYSAQALWLGLLVYARGLAGRPTFRGGQSWYRKVAPLSVWVALHALANTFVLAIAASLGPGAVAAYNYAMKLPGAIGGMIAGALTQASLPYLARHASSQEWTGLRRLMRAWTRAILLLGVPAALGMAFISEALVDVIFRGGAFRAGDVRIVGWVQAALFLQIPFYVLTQFQSRFLIATDKQAHLSLAGACLLVFTVLLGVPLSRFLDVAGLGLAVAAAFACVGALYWYYLKRLMPAHDSLPAA